MTLAIKDIKSKLSLLPLEQQRDVLKLLEQYETAKNKEEAKKQFLPFVKMMWSAFVGGPHHDIMADSFERVARGELKRLIINMPPRRS